MPFFAVVYDFAGFRYAFIFYSVEMKLLKRAGFKKYKVRNQTRARCSSNFSKILCARRCSLTMRRLVIFVRMRDFAHVNHREKCKDERLDECHEHRQWKQNHR